MFIRGSLSSAGSVALDAWQTATGSNAPQQVIRSKRRSARGLVSETRTSKRLAEIEAWGKARKMILGVLENQRFEILMGVIILSNLGVMVAEVNHDAKCYRASVANEPCRKDSYTLFTVINCVLITIYVTEVVARIFTYRKKFAQRAWNLVDLTIVLTGVVDMILDLSPINTGAQKFVFRFFRVARLARGVRLLAFFPQLNRLILLLGGALTPLYWGFVLILLMILFWSVTAVEFINPMMDGVPFGSEEETCKDVFTSVWRAALFFFQTHVAQDEWGTCIIPLIAHEKSTALLFVFANISVQLGLLNIIVSAVVDSACAAREQDHLQRAVENKQTELKKLEDWREIFSTIDANNDGQVTLREFLDGFDVEENVREYLTGLNINRDDLRYIFNLMDADNSGDLSYNEFVNTLVKAQSQDQRIYMMTVKLQTEQILQTVRQQGDALQAICTAMGCVDEDEGRVESATEASRRRSLEKRLGVQEQLDQGKSTDETSDEAEASTIPSARGMPLDQAVTQAAAKSLTAECVADPALAHVLESTGASAGITTENIASLPVVHLGIPSPTFSGRSSEVASVPRMSEENKRPISPRVFPRWLSDIGKQTSSATGHAVPPTQHGQGVEIPGNKLKHADIDQHHLAEGPEGAQRSRNMGVMFSTFESMAPIWTANGSNKKGEQAPPSVDELNQALPPHSGLLHKSASLARSRTGISGNMKPPGLVQMTQESTNHLDVPGYRL